MLDEIKQMREQKAKDGVFSLYNGERVFHGVRGERLPGERDPAAKAEEVEGEGDLDKNKAEEADLDPEAKAAQRKQLLQSYYAKIGVDKEAEARVHTFMWW